MPRTVSSGAVSDQGRVVRLIPRLCVWACLAPCLLAGASTGAVAATGVATLRWVAPGDDGRIGRAAAYDIRYSLAPITAANFHSATPAAGVPPPQYPGELEVFRITNLVPGTGYYFAIETVDAAQNWSPLSNIAYYVVGVATADVKPQALSLSQPWPNPARGSVHWSFALQQAAALEIEAFGLTGGRVRTIARAWREPGQGEVDWDLRDDRGRAVAPGIYMIRASLGGQTWVNRLVVAH